ncbi:MAG: ClpXP protease specificity-enhancing factor SspB, partial [Dongiaceae bacterium]
MAEDRLKYDKMVEGALRGVVREALNEAATNGLPGDHHFYITFHTDAPDVIMPDWLRAQYVDQMTIILQNQFWGLEVAPESFAVTLSFNNRQERLCIPFDAISGFADPAVQFGLQFEATEADLGAAGG